MVTYDGSRHQSGLALYLNGRAVPTQGRGNQNIELTGDIGVDAPLMLGKSLAGGAIADFRIFNRVSAKRSALLSEWPPLRRAGRARAQCRLRALLNYFLLNEYEPYRKLAAEQNELNCEGRGDRAARRRSRW